MANGMRYSYLRGAGGKFRNPYDHGVRKNCSEFLTKGYNEDIEAAEERLNSEETSMIQMATLATPNGEKQAPQANGNGHVCIDVDSKGSPRAHGHAHTSKCGHGKSSSISSSSKGIRIPFGLGLGLGRSNARQGSRSILAT